MSTRAKTRGHADQLALRRVANTSSQLSELTHKRADDIKRRALETFMTKQIISNEWRTSETTPPKYAESFVVTKTRHANGSFTWEVRNFDPGAQFVEYGAHAGGRTAVLGYRPLTTALLAAGFTH